MKNGSRDPADNLRACAEAGNVKLDMMVMVVPSLSLRFCSLGIRGTRIGDEQQ